MVPPFRIRPAREGELAALTELVLESKRHWGYSAELEHLWVRPGAMGAGVGGRLFEHALRIARAAGAKAMIVVSDPNAEGFYERLGARRVDFVPSRPEGRVLPRLRIDL